MHSGSSDVVVDDVIVTEVVVGGAVEDRVVVGEVVVDEVVVVLEDETRHNSKLSSKRSTSANPLQAKFTTSPPLV